MAIAAVLAERLPMIAGDHQQRIAEIAALAQRFEQLRDDRVGLQHAIVVLVPGALGTERPLGKGAVGIERFVATLKEIGFQGTLNVEREMENQEERLRDIRAAVAWLKTMN